MLEAEVVDPELEIVDPHRHLFPHNHWVKPRRPYLLEELSADVSAGHNVVSTIYVEASQLFKLTGPEAQRSTGEAEFAAVIGQISDTGHFGKARICEAFVGRADLTKGAAVQEDLDRLHIASDERLRGIRFPTNWDADARINPSLRPFAPPGLMSNAMFRDGVATLTRNQLTFDAWQYFPQSSELAALAAALPDTIIICCHAGGLLGTHGYSNPENFSFWRSKIEELAELPNIFMKIGGLANERTGFGIANRVPPASEDELLALWRPYIDGCITAFGPERCMFESNFSVDMCATDYRTLWNVFKRAAAGCSQDEKTTLFAGTARHVYRLGRQ